MTAEEERLSNGELTVRFHGGIPVSLTSEGRPLLSGPFLRSGVTYGRRRRRKVEIARWRLETAEVCGEYALLGFRGSVKLRRRDYLVVEREFLIARDLPYLWLTVRVLYPRSPDWGTDHHKAGRLGTGYDRRWREVWPAEVRPDWRGPFTVWKHNYWGEITSYRPRYADFSANRSLPSFNNHVTAGWVAASGEERGLLLGQTVRSRTSAAFCPMRTVRRLGREELRMNPFGTYDGRQLRSPIAETGFGRLTAVHMAEHLHSLAPSYNGQEEHFELLLAPFAGERPPEQYIADAWANAFPPLLLPRRIPLPDGMGQSGRENGPDKRREQHQEDRRTSRGEEEQ
jgi:hypothetical protein